MIERPLRVNDIVVAKSNQMAWKVIKIDDRKHKKVVILENYLDNRRTIVVSFSALRTDYTIGRI